MNRLQGAPRNERRAAEKYLKAQNQRYPVHLVELPRADWPAQSEKLLRVWRSRSFLVQEYNENGTSRLSVNRTSLTVGGRWSDQISWDELQEIKRQVGYGDIDAVEVYPADRDVVNVANMRHLWLIPAGVPFKWRRP